LTTRDITGGTPVADPTPPSGRKFIAVIGIDRYRSWPALHNAVSDARGARDLFLQLGFEEMFPPLLDDMATGDAIRRLVTDDLAKLRATDSLILFFAGHGHTQSVTFENGPPVKTGYIVPVDGDQPGGVVASWLRIDSWLSDVARLPVRHILVILDACYSGVALGSLVHWRGAGGADIGSLESLQCRRSRRVITSALDDQRAIDSGPLPGHSLFTGCLIEGLTWGLAQRGRRVATSSEIGLYVQERVAAYPSSAQTPDFGTLELDDRGELVIQLSDEPPRASTPHAVVPRPSARSAAYGDRPLRGARIVRPALPIVLIAASICAVVEIFPYTGAPAIPEHTTAVDAGGIRADTWPGNSPADAATQLDAATRPSDAQVARTPPPHDFRKQPASSPRASVQAAEPMASLKLDDPGPIRAQAEGELENDPRKAIDIILRVERDPSYRHDAEDADDGNRIKAMAHCQLRSTEAAESLYRLLTERARARVLAYCQKFGIESLVR
jgi:uncharacterized caspase-like protein